MCNGSSVALVACACRCSRALEAPKEALSSYLTLIATTIGIVARIHAGNGSSPHCIIARQMDQRGAHAVEQVLRFRFAIARVTGANLALGLIIGREHLSTRGDRQQ